MGLRPGCTADGQPLAPCPSAGTFGAGCAAFRDRVSNASLMQAGDGSPCSVALDTVFCPKPLERSAFDMGPLTS